MEDNTLTIREALKRDDIVIAEHLHHLVLELGATRESMGQDWLDKTLKFMDRARHELQYKGFIAEVKGQVVGSTSCQILELYPMVSQGYQKGYIWGVYVDLSYRRQGIATKLMNQARGYLTEIGCTKAVLHASEQGKLLYTRLGYAESNEMVLSLV